VDGADGPLLPAVVAEGTADLLDPTGDGGLADEAAAPHGVHELFLGHDPVAVPDQVHQDVERLRFQGDRGTLSSKLEQRFVELDDTVQEQDHVSWSHGPVPGRVTLRRRRW
jgi:hypothetical protein